MSDQKISSAIRAVQEVYLGVIGIAPETRAVMTSDNVNLVQTKVETWALSQDKESWERRFKAQIGDLRARMELAGIAYPYVEYNNFGFDPKRAGALSVIDCGEAGIREILP